MNYIILNLIFTILYDEKNTLCHTSASPITFVDVLNVKLTKYKSLSKSFVSRALSHFTVEALSSRSNITVEQTKLINSIQGSIEVNNQMYFIMNGNWFFIKEDYITLISNDFKKYLVYNKKEVTALFTKFKLENVHKVGEDAYNRTFKNSNTIIYAHTTLINNVELADLIFFDEDNLYLMHNKGKFDGSGVRDVSNQIATAAELLSTRMKIRGDNFLSSYYDKLMKEDSTLKNCLKKTEFTSLFKKNIVFIAGFMSSVKENTRSTYAKYILTDLDKSLSTQEQRLLIMSTND